MATTKIQIRTLIGGPTADLRVVTFAQGELIEPVVQRVRELGYCVWRPYVVENGARRILHARIRHPHGLSITAERALTVVDVVQELLSSGREDSVVAPLPGARSAEAREWLAASGGRDWSSTERPARDSCAA